ncbi:MAG: tetratricopeptide repeat protein [Deltaproteobacteria bacterium]
MRENISNIATSKWRLPLALLLIAGLTVAVYWQVLFSEFITYDDTDYVLKNQVVRQGLTLEGLIWSFTSFHAANWHPLTWLSHMLDVELFGLNPMGHHAISLLLHTLNSVLLCILLHSLTGFIGRSMFVAMLFAIHPLHVESVAWVAERKDVLSTLFWFLTMGAYVWYVRNPCLRRYLTVTVFFALGLMSKQMLVTLPLVLLLMDYWPLNRLSIFKDEGEADRSTFKTLLIEKIPLFVMSVAAALATILAQGAGGAIRRGDEESATLLYFGNAFLSYVKYLRNMFWPIDLALFYPFEVSAVTALKVTGAVALLAALSALAIAQRRKRPYLLFGWFWFLITLLPVIGFIKVGAQAIADRYTYIPLIGLFLLLTWGVAEMEGKWRNGLLAARVGAAIAIVVLSLLSVGQVRYWKNSYSLFAHAVAVVERNWLAYNNMGILLSQHHRNDEAIFYFQKSVRINPNGTVGFKNLGNAYQMAGRSAEAIQAYREVVRIAPNDVEGHYRLGYAYLLSGNIDLANREYEQLKRLDETRANALLDSIQTRTKQ